MPHEALLAELTPSQREAVAHVEGPLLILAGPGSGKTRVVTHRVAHLLAEGIPASQIVALTFTNKAAEEMAARVAQLAPDRRVWMSTFHRFGARLLREFGTLVGIEPNFTIYDTQDSRQVLRRAIEAGEVKTLHYTPERIAAAISKAKNNLLTADKYQPHHGSPLSRIVAESYPIYQQRLRAANAVDFDDLLLSVAELLYQSPEVRSQLDARYRFVLVDEYQDTNQVQYVILRALSVDYPNLAVTGDPDQSIYGWRGANLSNILEFESDFPDVRVVRLEQNYRSTQRILRVADQLIGYNQQRKKKRLFTENEEGAPVRLVCYANEVDEASDVVAQIAELLDAGHQPREIAVFYRINALSRAFEGAFRNANVPFQLIRAQEFYQRKEIKDVLAYCQLVNNPRDDVAFLRCVNTPPRGIGRKTLERLAAHADANGSALLDAAREAGISETVQKRAAVQIAKFVALYDHLGEFAHAPVEEILGNVLDATGYRAMLAETDTEEDLDRLANIEELLTDARQFDEEEDFDGGLEAYLERLWLVSDVDDWDAETDRVSLMTLHAAKGLEFPIVFMPAVEQGLLPHERSSNDVLQIEEERRLAFVGITRAKASLQLSYAAKRDFRGVRRSTVPSEFLLQMPREDMTIDLVDPWDRAEGSGFRVQGSEFGEDVESVRRPTEGKRAGASPKIDLAKAVTTGAALAGGAEPKEDPSQEPHVQPNPDAFAHGMAVVHPEYGPGKIVALSGAGKNRRATVRFPTAGEKRFVLIHSPLKPAGS